MATSFYRVNPSTLLRVDPELVEGSMGDDDHHATHATPSSLQTHGMVVEPT